MRGLAAFLVVLIHSGGAGLRELGFIGNSIVDHAKYGVVLFYVLSAFSIALSIADRSTDWKAFYVRRFFRIGPLYLAVLLYVVVRSLLSGEATQASLVSFAAHVSLANIILLQFANDMLGVEWSIVVEVSFYLVFPIVIALSSPLVALLAVGSYLLGRILLDPSLLGGYGQFTLLLHFYAFAIGLLVFRLSRRPSPTVGGIRLAIGLLSLLCPTVAIVFGEGSLSGPLCAIGGGMALLHAHMGGVTRRIFSSPAVVYCGKVSFSTYLLHLFVLGTFSGLGPSFGFVADFVLIIAVSSVTYLTIEGPGRTLGRFIAEGKSRDLMAKGDT